MADKVQVTVKSGPIEGVRKVSRMETPYLSFQRIPYAKPPLGKLRFKDPEPADPWTEVLDCSEEGPQCSQLYRKSPVGEEDCLYLNVYTKQIEPEKPYPVMIYIHGGGFMTGTGGMARHAPDFLFQKDVLLVTFHYRLGAFGFLSVEDPAADVPGNAGLKDQNLALKWVKENIQFFGGDPNNITLTGHSAGAASVHFHLVSNMSKNLFNRAIIQSAAILSDWAVTPRNRALRLAKILGWDESQGDGHDMVEFLRAQDHLKIAEGQEKILTPEEKLKLSLTFGPVIEPYMGKQCLIPVHPKDMCRRAWSRSLPIIIGGSSEEGLISYKAAKENPQILSMINNNWELMIPSDAGARRDADRVKVLAKQLKELYFNDQEVSEESILDYCTFMTDKLFGHGIHRTILSRVNSLERGSTWIYRFSFDSPSFNHYRNNMCGDYEVRGACHGDELSYLYADTMEGTDVPEPTTPEFKMIQTMVELWTNFATSGNPNSPHNENIKGTKWEPIPNKTLPYKVLNINEKLEMVELPEAKRMEIWDSIYENDELY